MGLSGLEWYDGEVEVQIDHPFLPIHPLGQGQLEDCIRMDRQLSEHVAKICHFWSLKHKKSLIVLNFNKYSFLKFWVFLLSNLKETQTFQ